MYFVCEIRKSTFGILKENFIHYIISRYTTQLRRSIGNGVGVDVGSSAQLEEVAVQAPDPNRS